MPGGSSPAVGTSGRLAAANSTRVAPGLLIAFYALLVAVWVVSNPVGAAPDETDHYLRAVAAGRGDLVGRPFPPAEADAADPPPKTCCTPDNPTARFSENGLTRVVRVPARLAPDGFGCYAFVSTRTARCLDELPPPSAGPTDQPTRMGTVPVTPYLLPGLATRLAGDATTALRLARAANAALAVGLLSLAVLLVWSPASPLSLLGLVTSVTPTVLFVSSSVSNSAPEIAGGICFLAGLLRLTRGEAPGRWVWAALALSGVALASSRSLGPVWVVLAVLAVGVFAGRRTLWRRFREGTWAAGAAAAAVALAAAATVAWEVLFQTAVDFDVPFFLAQLPRALPDLPRVAREVVGRFGWMDTPLPVAAFLAWGAAATVWVGAALAVGGRRQRAVLVLFASAGAAVTVLVSAALLRQNGFYVNGRHVLAVVPLVPLVAGEVLLANRDRLGARWRRRLPPAVVAVAVAVHGVALFANARRYAVGTEGPVAFLARSEWRPPGGWWPWATVVVVAMALGAASPVAGARGAGRAGLGRARRVGGKAAVG